jgi:hypothetical protein
VVPARAWLVWWLGASAACGGGDGPQIFTESQTESGSAGTQTGSTTTDGSGVTGTSGALDLPPVSDFMTQPVCTVDPEGIDAAPPCVQTTPPDSFDPVIEWEWWGDGEYRNSLTTPLVANLTDDNDDGVIDLCDVPDILVLVHVGLTGDPERMVLLDGATGTPHWTNTTEFAFSWVPAIGDVDGDGVPDIVAGLQTGEIVLLDAAGQEQWRASASFTQTYRPAIALADLDADGDVEIIVGTGVFDHTGTLLWSNTEPMNFYHTTTAADLDGDGLMEVVVGRSAYHHDGTPYYEHPTLMAAHPAVANLDADPEPEVLLTSQEGISILEHDGTIKFQNQTPTGDPASNNMPSSPCHQQRPMRPTTGTCRFSGRRRCRT